MANDFVIAVNVQAGEGSSMVYLGTDVEGYPYITHNIASATRYVDAASTVRIYNALRKIFQRHQDMLIRGIFRVERNARIREMGEDLEAYIYEASTVYDFMKSVRKDSKGPVDIEIVLAEIVVEKIWAFKIESSFCDPAEIERRARFEQYQKLKEEFGNM